MPVCCVGVDGKRTVRYDYNTIRLHVDISPDIEGTVAEQHI